MFCSGVLLEDVMIGIVFDNLRLLSISEKDKELLSTCSLIILMVLSYF